jgi:hypothetical protein
LGKRDRGVKLISNLQLKRMPSSGILRRVALVRTDAPRNVAPTQAAKKFLRSVRRLLVTANVVPSTPILVTVMMEALRFSEA